MKVLQKEEFQPYIKDDRLIVTKRISSENDRIMQRYYAAALQIPRFAEIRVKPGKRDRVSAWKEMVDSDELPNLGEKVRSADEVEQLNIEDLIEKEDMAVLISNKGFIMYYL